MSRSTFHELMQDDAHALAIRAAVDQGLGLLEQRIVEAGVMGDWRACARLLEQRIPGEWSTRAQVEHAGRVQVEARVIGPPGPEISRLLADPERAKVLFDLLDAEEAAEAAARETER